MMMMMMMEPQRVQRCRVCDQEKASNHYGSVCCAGCKGFFRRTVRFARQYVCPRDGQCEIDKEARNWCRACRYRKCLDAGLNPRLLHGDRGAITSSSSNQHSGQQQQQQPATTKLPPEMEKEGGGTDERFSFSSSQPPPPSNNAHQLPDDFLPVSGTTITDAVAAAAAAVGDAVALLAAVGAAPAGAAASGSNPYAQLSGGDDASEGGQQRLSSLSSSAHRTMQLATSGGSSISSMYQSASTSSTSYTAQSTQIPLPWRIDDHANSVAQLALGYRRLITVPSVHNLGGGFGSNSPTATSTTTTSALAQYFLSVERLCDMYIECSGLPSPQFSFPSTSSAAFAASSSSSASTSSASFSSSAFLPVTPKNYNLELSASLAYKKPGLICERTPIGWQVDQSGISNPATMTSTYCRVLVHYFDWASHIPELELFSEEDRALLVTKRSVRCMWLLMAHRSAQNENVEGIACSGRVYYPCEPTTEATIAPEIREFFSQPFNLAWSSLVKPLRELRITEQEYALLRVICFFMPTAQLSAHGQQLVAASHQKYLNALIALVLESSSSFTNTSSSTPTISTLSPSHGTLAEPSSLGPSEVASTAKVPLQERAQRNDEEEVTSSRTQIQLQQQQSLLLRMSRLITLLSVVEQVSQLDDNAITVLSVFNMVGMRGTLPHEIHIG